MAKHNLIGRRGEAIAVDYFQQKGYQILHKNWRKGRNEIDIIAFFSNAIHFIEVKTRMNHNNTLPEFAVNRAKLKRMMIAAASYIQEMQPIQGIQFDILAITLLPEIEIYLIEDVYLYEI